MHDVRYERPDSVGAACALLAQMPDATAVLAGGTDLLVKLRAGQLTAGLMMDVKRIPELGEIRWSAAGDLSLGAAVTMGRIAEDKELRKVYPALAEGARAVGSLQIRERATVGGNLCNASPCMDTAPALLVLDARVVAASSKGKREIPLSEFFVGPKRTALAPGELVTEIIVPAASKSRLCAFEKIKRVRGHDLALVNAAAAFDVHRRTLLAAVGSCGPTPILTAPSPVERGTSAAAAGERLAAAALEQIRPIDDLRASAAYRREMTALLCRRLAARLLDQEGVA